MHRAWAADLRRAARCTSSCGCGSTCSSSSRRAPTPSWTAATSSPAPVHFWLGGNGRPRARAGVPAPAQGARRGAAHRAGVHGGVGPGPRAGQAPAGGGAAARSATAPCVLDAQEHLTALYGGFGFVPSGPGYDWDGVPHVPMRRPVRGTPDPTRSRPDDSAGEAGQSGDMSDDAGRGRAGAAMPAARERGAARPDGRSGDRPGHAGSRLTAATQSTEPVALPSGADALPPAATAGRPAVTRTPRTGRALDRADPLRAGPAVPAGVHPAEPRAGADRLPRASRASCPPASRCCSRRSPGCCWSRSRAACGSCSCAGPPAARPARSADVLRIGGRPVPGRRPGPDVRLRHHPVRHHPPRATPPRSSGPTSPRGCCGTSGVEVEVCRNVTDVDDVLDAAAARAGARFDSFAAVQQFRFDRDMAALGVRRPTHEPRAHNHVAAGRDAGRGAARGRRGLPARRHGLVPRARAWPPRAGLDRAAARGAGRASSAQPGESTPGAEHPADVAGLAGGGRGRRSRPGRARGATGGRAGTPSARRWR